jgi:hypothetical protein
LRASQRPPAHLLHQLQLLALVGGALVALLERLLLLRRLRLLLLPLQEGLYMLTYADVC